MIFFFSFFYIIEGLDFINKKNSDEACAAAEKYGETRKKLREIIRLHNRKQLMKKNPFKNKVGGMTKKQMINSKNRHKVFDKKRPPKVQQEFCLICHFLLSLLLKLIYRRLAPVNGNLSPECADVLLSFDALSISNAKALLFFNRLTNTA